MSELLAELAAKLEDQAKRPPVHLWNPELSGNIDIQIKADGSWWHEGAEIQKDSLVRLFASILRREQDGQYYLVTPAEKWCIAVEDKPLNIVAMEVAGEGIECQIFFTTNVDWHYLLSAKYPLKIDRVGEESRPYIVLDNGLEARIGRNVYYRMMDLVVEDGEDYFLQSDGKRFELT